MRRGERARFSRLRTGIAAAVRYNPHLSEVTGSSSRASRERPNRPKPVVLLILDGWGHRDDPPDNALAQADLPNWRALWATRPHTLIHTEGRHVGLPDGQMGNSEVGHMNLGAGRIVYQDLTRIDAAIEDGSFFDNPELRAACAAANASGGTLHVMGLLSPGGVHSHERAHVRDARTGAARAASPRVAVHAFLDGRDTPPQSAQPSLAALQRRVRCARQRAHRQRQRPLLRDGSRPALGARAARLGCDRRRARRIIARRMRGPRSRRRMRAARTTNSSRRP